MMVGGYWLALVPRPLTLPLLPLLELFGQVDPRLLVLRARTQREEVLHHARLAGAVLGELDLQLLGQVAELLDGVQLPVGLAQGAGLIFQPLRLRVDLERGGDRVDEGRGDAAARLAAVLLGGLAGNPKQAREVQPRDP